MNNSQSKGIVLFIIFGCANDVCKFLSENDVEVISISESRESLTMHKDYTLFYKKIPSKTNSTKKENKGEN